MRSRKEIYFRSLLTLSLALLFPVIMAAQSEDAARSAIFPRNRSVKQRLEKILQHLAQTPPALEEQPSPMRRWRTVPLAGGGGGGGGKSVRPRLFSSANNPGSPACRPLCRNSDDR